MFDSILERYSTMIFFVIFTQKEIPVISFYSKKC
uniref:Uncharacterized protein n=1 Tax=Siphoviridae sp. ctYtb10 TaxID=2825553 RepID=A0A8S5PAN8_9CAUD|nr:MAG TPA: hypothetical protein [Siphoviridae sp. ctYtb10]